MYAITAATGHTGKIVTETLLSRGQKVRTIGRSLDRLSPFTQRGAEAAIAETTDIPALTAAFTSARAVYLVMPQEHSTDNYRAFQDHVTNAFATALQNASVPYAVALSSVGADKPAGTGPIVGLHILEERLSKIPGLSVLFLRAGLFMENYLTQIPTIKAAGAVIDARTPDLPVPTIATRDIGAAAAEALLQLNFEGRQTCELLGPRDLSIAEITALLAKALNLPDLRYIQAPDEDLRKALLQAGLKPDIINLLLEMTHAINSKHVRPLEPRSPKNTTPTTFEQFTQDTFLPAYRSR